MKKIYAIPMTLYVQALNPEMAAGKAELSAFSATVALRKEGSGWITDKVSTVVTNGVPVEALCSPSEVYNKDILIKAYGEDRAIRFLNHSLDAIHL